MLTHIFGAKGEIVYASFHSDQKKASGRPFLRSGGGAGRGPLRARGSGRAGLGFQAPAADLQRENAGKKGCDLVRRSLGK